jgi:hypothetical protein
VTDNSPQLQEMSAPIDRFSLDDTVRRRAVSHPLFYVWMRTVIAAINGVEFTGFLNPELAQEQQQQHQQVNLETILPEVGGQAANHRDQDFQSADAPAAPPERFVAAHNLVGNLNPGRGERGGVVGFPLAGIANPGTIGRRPEGAGLGLGAGMGQS